MSRGTTSRSGQRPCASRRRMPTRAPPARAAGETATTRLPATTTTSADGGQPAHMTAQSAQEATRARDPIAEASQPARPPAPPAGERNRPGTSSPAMDRNDGLPSTAVNRHLKRSTQPEPRPPGPRSSALAGRFHLHFAAPQVTVTIFQASPTTGNDTQAHIGRARPTLSQDGQDRSPLAPPGLELAGDGVAHMGGGA
jgi:hypothetical protein